MDCQKNHWHHQEVNPKLDPTVLALVSEYAAFGWAQIISSRSHDDTIIRKKSCFSLALWVAFSQFKLPSSYYEMLYTCSMIVAVLKHECHVVMAGSSSLTRILMCSVSKYEFEY